MEYGIKELTELLSVLNDMHKSGLKVNQEVNKVLGITMFNLGIHESSKVRDERIDSN